jgi:hypothetical protein
MRKIILAVVVGIGLSALAAGPAQAKVHHHWRHWRHHHYPIFFTPDYYDYYPDAYDPYYSPGYAPYYAPPELLFGFGFGGYRHHWHH